MTENITVDMTNLSDKEREQLIALISKANSKFTMPKNLEPGDVFKDIDGEEWIFLYYDENGNACIFKKTSVKEMKFGSNNNYNGSDIDKYLTDTYLKELERKFGAENIVEHEVDLLSLDGENDYGKITRKVNIPTLDMYRHNKKAIKKSLGKWFWLATPNSTPSGCGSDSVRCVDYGGDVGCIWCNIDRGAVRPCLFLNRKLFEE
jgi:hypothetical protein